MARTSLSLFAFPVTKTIHDVQVESERTDVKPNLLSFETMILFSGINVGK